MNQKIAGMRIVKSLFFMPLVLAAVTVGVIFGWFYNPTFGLLAIIYHAFGATAPALLSDENLVTLAVVIASLWPQVAFRMVLFLAGLNNLDEEMIGEGRVILHRTASDAPKRTASSTLLGEVVNTVTSAPRALKSLTAT